MDSWGHLILDCQFIFAPRDTGPSSQADPILLTSFLYLERLHIHPHHLGEPLMVCLLGNVRFGSILVRYCVLD
jgi:hypothetical protein